jgi:hypothetical protein
MQLTTSLESRFLAFLNDLDGAESIDLMALPDEEVHTRKADFLLANRRVIAEVKAITKDVSGKIEAEMDRHRTRPEFPHFYGEAELSKILARLPDGPDINRRIYNNITRLVETQVRSAEVQIEHTRKRLNLPNAAGLLIILNDAVDTLDPTVVGYRVAKLMGRSRTGAVEAKELDFASLLFESHSVGSLDGIPAHPNLLINGPNAVNFSWFKAFHTQLINEWSKSRNGVSISTDLEHVEELKYQSTLEKNRPSRSQETRTERWTRQYLEKPWMREMSDAEVLDRGGEILRRLEPYLLKGGVGYVEDECLPLLEQIAHFQLESTHRALDWRHIRRRS